MSTAVVLNSIQKVIYLYSSYVLEGLAFIGCIINISVFMKETLRKHPCTCFFIAINVLNFIYLNWLFIQRILDYGFNINSMGNNLIYCRCFTYVSFFASNCAPSYIILASIDRTLITSRSARIRQLSTRRLALISVITITLFWLILHIHGWFFIDLLQYGPNYFVCYYRPGVYTIFITMYSLSISGILLLSLMIIFGILSIRNIRQLNRNTNNSTAINNGCVAVGRSHTSQSKDRQLIRMVLVEIISYVVCKCPITIMLIYSLVTQYNQKSNEQISIEQSVFKLLYVLYFIDDCINCYMNILVSKAYRTELKSTLTKLFLHCN